mmetsp:Transcript_23972/g.55343  ORF Transcript_23972/g.55343 Transcript_23972/m.55343 type:complete len:203 (+) Transcript_23972:67-675(+)
MPRSLRSVSTSRAKMWNFLLPDSGVEQPCSGNIGDDTACSPSRSRSAEKKSKKLLRRYVFQAKGAAQQIEIEHAKWVWEVLVNGVVHQRRAHSYWDNHHNVAFMATTSTAGELVEIELDMQWDSRKTEWRYDLRVNGTDIPVAWTRTRGDEVQVDPPEVLDMDDVLLDNASGLRVAAAIAEQVQDLDCVALPATRKHHCVGC